MGQTRNEGHFPEPFALLSLCGLLLFWEQDHKNYLHGFEALASFLAISPSLYVQVCVLLIRVFIYNRISNAHQKVSNIID